MVQLDDFRKVNCRNKQAITCDTENRAAGGQFAVCISISFLKNDAKYI